MNYQALGEYTAFKKQAQDAADRRFALLHNLSAKLSGLSKDPERPVDADLLAQEWQDIGAADREFRAALARANAAAPLCGEREASARQFGRD